MVAQLRLALTILRRKQVELRTGLSRSSIYDHVKRGTFTRPVPLGGRSVGWPEHEVDMLNAARVAGLSDDAIRGLVAQLQSKRSVALSAIGGLDE